MAKTITIPTDLGYENSITLYINGKSYTYKPGETVSVPDDVAELIEDMELQKVSGGRAPADQADWDENNTDSPSYVKNRPFYTSGDTVIPILDKYIPDTIARASDLEALEARVAALEGV